MPAMSFQPPRQSADHPQQAATYHFVQAQTTPAASSTQVQNSTLVPIPVPVVTQKPVNVGSGALGVLALLLLATLLRFLWRLPQILENRGNTTVASLGGSYAVQNHLLRALGYLSVISGIGLGNVLGGLTLATLLMIAVSLRPQGAQQ